VVSEVSRLLSSWSVDSVRLVRRELLWKRNFWK
jgi:hypothetical protein